MYLPCPLPYSFGYKQIKAFSTLKGKEITQIYNPLEGVDCGFCLKWNLSLFIFVSLFLVFTISFVSVTLSSQRLKKKREIIIIYCPFSCSGVKIEFSGSNNEHWSQILGSTATFGSSHKLPFLEPYRNKPCLSWWVCSICKVKYNVKFWLFVIQKKKLPFVGNIRILK